MSRMRTKEDYLKRLGIDACLDDVRLKTEHTEVVCESELPNKKGAGYLGHKHHKQTFQC